MDCAHLLLSEGHGAKENEVIAFEAMPVGLARRGLEARAFPLVGSEHRPVLRVDGRAHDLGQAPPAGRRQRRVASASPRPPDR